MSEHHELAAAPRDESWARIERIVERFEDAWRQGKQPVLSEYVRGGEALMPGLLVELIRAELEFRLQAGEAARVEEYLTRYPELADERQGILALLQTEWGMRARIEPQLSVEEFQQRFPALAQELTKVLCHVSFDRQPDLPATLNMHKRLANPSSPRASPPVSVDFDLRGYEINEQLGKGGMGEVYRCCDPALGRDLAIKVVKKEHRGFDEAERRFLREARVTGSLQHPGIVPVHNLGRLRDGRLHYTMRLVRGRTFADILREEAGKPERLPYLLSIFEKICEAVAYAHSKRVIHRDLKPHNVMVGRFGEVQVMDWGLAKVLTPGDHTPKSEEKTDATGARIPTEADTSVDMTQQGSGFGTPAYMPPEQALGEWDTVDEHADVFALGSILCEILTGDPAYPGTDGNEVYRRAKRGDVAEALQRLQQCSADAALIALCRECLSPEREARPRDADAVAKRVAAYQAKVQERLRRAELERAEAEAKRREERERRRWTIRWAIALVLVLLAGATVSTWEALRAMFAESKAHDNERQALVERDEKDLAMRKAEKAAQDEQVAKQTAEMAARAEQKANKTAQDRSRQLEKTNEVLTSIFADLNPRAEQMGGPTLSQQLSNHLERAAAQLDAEAVGDRLMVARTQASLGSTLIDLGQARLAGDLLSKARATLEPRIGTDAPETLRCCNNLATAYVKDRRSADAISLLEPTLRKWKAKSGDDHEGVIQAQNCLALAYLDIGRPIDAIRLLEEALRLREAKSGADSPHALITLNNLAGAYQLVGRFSEAIRLHKKILNHLEAERGADHPETLSSRNNLAESYRTNGSINEAIRLHEQNLQSMEAKLGPEHPSTLIALHNLGTSYRDAGRAHDAIRLHEQSVKRCESKFGPAHPATLSSRNALARSYESAGRLKEAISLYEQTLKQRELGLGPDHPDTLTSRNNLAVAYQAIRRISEAIRLHEQNFKLREAKFGPEHPDTLQSRNNLAAAYWVAGKLDRSIPLFEQTLKLDKAKFGPDHPDTLLSMANLGVNYRDAGRLQDAISLLEAALQLANKRSGGFPVKLAWVPHALAETYERAEQFAKAEAIYRDSLELARRRFGSEDQRTVGQMALLGSNLLLQHRYSDAEPLLRDCLRVRAAKQPDVWSSFNARSLLGAAILGQKKYAEAGPLLLEGYEGMKAREAKIPPQGKVRLTEALERLVKFYEALNNKDEAAKWRKQLDDRITAQKKPKP